MPGFDWIPVVSQVKSFVQAITGDTEGAERTQQNFIRECPVVSQVTSLVQVSMGDADGALETQKQCLGTLNNFANGVPVVGHVKGVIHHIAGDSEGGNQALNAATRSTVVLASGAAAGITTGGLAAIPAGIAAGASYDLVDTAISDKPKGLVATVENVVKNPNGGNVFDAVASVAADGLAGYSGGKMGNKIANQVKINGLEAKLEAANNQLNAGLFPEDAGASPMTTGEALQLGKQITSLVNEINSLKQTAPQYFYDPKSNQIVVEYPKNSGGIGVPVPNQKAGSSSMSSNQSTMESALSYDFYKDESCFKSNALTNQQRSGYIQSYKSQSSNSLNLTQRHYNTSIKKDKMDNLSNEDPHKLKKSQIEEIFNSLWIHVRMPSNFGYTSAALLNNSFHGFQHTLLRHWDQWTQYVPGLSAIITQLASIQVYLDQIRNAQDAAQSGAAVNAFEQYLRNLAPAELTRIRQLLHEAQRLIYNFTQTNLRQANYLGEGVNNNGQVQVFFEVTDINGNIQVMVICVSSDLFPSISDFGDSRPVRPIVTIFFITKAQFLNKQRNGYITRTEVLIFFGPAINDQIQ